MSCAKQLAFEIETNRQRLQYALDTKNEELVNRINLLLVQLLAQYFDQTKTEVRMTFQNDTKWFLVFSEVYPDGIRVNTIGYRNLTKSMTRADLASHVCIEIESGAELAADEMIEISSMPKPWRTDKKGA